MSATTENRFASSIDVDTLRRRVAEADAEVAHALRVQAQARVAPRVPRRRKRELVRNAEKFLVGALDRRWIWRQRLDYAVSHRPSPPSAPEAAATVTLSNPLASGSPEA